jgi:DNA-binding MurR/RpiR family transcriptional regulator
MFRVEQVKSLNDLEMEVYQYVTKNYDKVKYMRIRELAQ